MELNRSILQDNQDTQEVSVTKTKAEIAKMFQNIRKHIDQLEKKTLDELESKIKSQSSEKEIEIEMDSSKLILDGMTSAVDLIKTSLEKGTRLSLARDKKILLARAETLKNIPSDLTKIRLGKFSLDWDGKKESLGPSFCSINAKSLTFVEHQVEEIPFVWSECDDFNNFSSFE